MGQASIERAATAAEIHQMKEVLKASVRAGAAGFSTNQNPVHMYADGTPIQSRFATDEEIIELARSEERRVGKECRARWSPHDLQENHGDHAERGARIRGATRFARGGRW